MHYFVAVDGSVMAELACDMVMKDLQKDGDNVTIAHVSDKSKGYLPMKMRPHYVKTSYETKIITTCTPEKTASYWEEEKDVKLNSKQMLWNMAEKKEASIIVVGGHGRKGPKADETVLGSAI